MLAEDAAASPSTYLPLSRMDSKGHLHERHAPPELLKEEVDSFWAKVDENIEMVESFYLDRISEYGTTFRQAYS